METHLQLWGTYERTSCSKVKWQRKRKWRPLERKSQKIPTKTTRKRSPNDNDDGRRLFGTSSSSWSPTFYEPKQQTLFWIHFVVKKIVPIQQSNKLENWKQTKFWLLHVSVQSSVGELFYSSFGTVFFSSNTRNNNALQSYVACSTTAMVWCCKIELAWNM